jgi:hypothetical protein
MEGGHYPPDAPYDGPDFDEYCIAEGRYLSARRNRIACATCPLRNLCEAGFDEQVRRVAAGENPSLTEGCAFEADELSAGKLLDGLTDEQIQFVKSNIPLFDRGVNDGD